VHLFQREMCCFKANYTKHITLYDVRTMVSIVRVVRFSQL